MTSVFPPSAGPKPGHISRQSSDLAEVLTAGYASSVACSESSSEHVTSSAEADADESIRLILREGETATVQAILKECGAAPGDTERVTNLMLATDVTTQELLESHLDRNSAAISLDEALSNDVSQAANMLTRAKLEWMTSNVGKIATEWCEAPDGFESAMSAFVRLDVVGAILARAEAGTGATGIFADLEAGLEKDIEDAENAMGQVELMTAKAAAVKIVCRLDTVLVKALLLGPEKSGLRIDEFRWLVLMRQCCKGIVDL